jgi:PAS domain S-box-containing protein
MKNRETALLKENEELKIRLAKAEEAQKISNLGSWELDIPTGRMKWSDHLYRIFNLDPATVNPELDNFFLQIHPDDKEKARKHFETVAQKPASYTSEYRLILKSGEMKYIQTKGRAIEDDAGNIVGIFGTSQDITVHKIAEQELHTQQQLLEAIVNNIPTGIDVIRGSDLRIQFANPAYRSVAPGKEMIGKTLDEIWPETNRTFKDICNGVLETGVPHHVVDELNMISRTPGGPLEPAFFTWSLIRVPLPGNEGWGIINTTTETTGRKKLEEAIRESEERFVKAFQSNPAALSITRLSDGMFVDMNNAFLKLFGYERDELIGIKSTDIKMFTDNDDRKEIIRLLNGEGKIRNYELRAQNSKGEEMILMFSAEKINFHGEEHILYSTLDITERKASEENLRASREQLAAVFNGVTETIMLMDIQGNILAANKIAEHRLNPDKQDMAGKNIFDILPAGFHQKRKQQIAELVRIKEPITFLDKFNDTYQEISLYPVFDAEGNVKQLISSALDVTERIKSEEKLRASEQKLNDIYASMSEGLALHEIVYDSQGKAVDYIITDVNPAFVTNTGLDRGKIIRKKATEAYSQKEVPYLDIFAGVASSGKPVSFESYFPPIDRHFSISVFSPGQGKFGTVFQDITERRKIEKALQESEKKYREIIKYAPTVIFEIDFRNQKFITVNDSMSFLSGYTTDELLSLNPFDLLEEESKILFESKIQKVLKGEVPPENVEYRVKSKDGRIIFAILNTSFNFVETGKPIGATVVGHDITERKKMEEELRKNEKLLKSILDNANSGVALIDEAGRFSVYNPLFLKLFGLSEDSTIKNVNDQNWADWQVFNENGKILPVDEHPVRKAVLTGKRVEHQMVGVRLPSGGEITWMQISAEPIFKENGNLEKIICTYHDITERKAAEEALQVALVKYKTLFDCLPLGITVTDEQGNILESNKLSEILLGLRPEEQTLRTINGIEWQILNPDSTPMSPDNYASVRALKENRIVENVEMGIVKADGEVTWINVSAVPIPLNGFGVIITYNDITHRRSMEDTLRESEENLRGIMEATQESIWMFSTEGKILLANTIALDRMGKKAEEIIGKRMDEVLPSDLSKSRFAMLRYTVETARPFDFEDTRAGFVFAHSFYPVLDRMNRVTAVVSFSRDITQQKKTENNLYQLIRTLRAMQNSSVLMVNAIDEQKFLQDVCRIIVEDCGHKMVWIGFKQNDSKKSVKPVAFAGFEENYLEMLGITWADTERGRGPTGMAIRTGKPTLCRNMQTDPNFKPWRAEAVKRGYSSSIVLPLLMDEDVFGVMNIYSKEPDGFSEDEQQLLAKLSIDLAYGIKAIRLNIALNQAKEDLEAKVEQRTSLLQKTMNDLDMERQRFQDLLNMIPAYVALITLDNKIAFSNKIFTEYFGAVDNQRCYEIFFGRTEICENCKAKKVISGRKPLNWEAVCKNDRIYQISDFSFSDKDGTSLILEIGVDITEKRNMEKLVLSKILETEERDRKRFATDLHDDLGPTLSAIKIQLSLLGTVKNDKERKELLAICDQLLLDGIDKMRTLANNIMPSLIESYGLETAVKSFFKKMEKPSQLTFKFSSNLKGYRFHQESELHLYRIVTELVNNTIKHSGATKVTLDLKLTEQEFRMIYSDNGIGYTVAKDDIQSSGIGIQNMMNRINLLHGNIDFMKKEGKTVVIVSKPLTHRISFKPLS